MIKKFFAAATCMSLIILFAASVSAQDWYDTDWAYRIPVWISNPTGAMELTDYQVQVPLDDTFDYDSALADGSDLRVTDSEGANLIPFWIESWNPPDSASIWVKVPSIPTDGAKIYVYYGNNSPSLPDPVEVPPVGPWNRHPDNPIVPIGDPGGGSNLLAENIVYDSVTGHYWLVFANYRSGSSVGLIWSDDPEDPTSWHWHGTVVSNANAPHIIEHDGIWYIFYADRGHGGPPYPISVSTSSSIKGPYTYAATVLTSTEPWEAYRVDEPYVFQRSDGKWILMYMGDAGSTTERVGYAEADNILGPYTKFSGNPCIDFGPPGSIDAGTVADPWVVEFQGTYYIGYTVSATKSSPWRTAYVTTTDWQTFTKQGLTLDWGPAGAWDQCNAFRGAVTRFGDKYYFPFTGRYCSGSPISGYIMGIVTQNAFMTPEINSCGAVFEFCDTFDGDALDTTKWVTNSVNGTHTVDVSQGQLNLTANYGIGSYGYIEMRGNIEIGTGTLLEAYADHSSAGLNCDSDSDTDNAAELGYKPADFSFNNNIRIMDYPFSDYYTVQTRLNGSSDTTEDSRGYLKTLFPLSPDQKYYSVYRSDSGPVAFDINKSGMPYSVANPSYIPTFGLYPWLMSYAESCAASSTLSVDWIRVRKFFGSDPVITVGTEEPYEIEVAIDIKPGSYPNCINNDGKGVIPVAILGAPDFDVACVDVELVGLAGMAVKAVGKSNKLLAHYEDVNGDGIMDLVVQIQDTDGLLGNGEGTATLTGKLLEECGSFPIIGEDEICLVPKN